MNARLRPALLVPLALSFSLSQCATQPPYLPPNAGTGVSLDSGPRQGRQETRYLENTLPPPLPFPGSVATGPTYETPEDIDLAGPPAPSDPPQPASPSIAETPPPPIAPTEPTPPQPKPADPQPAQIPFGLPVPGKKGFVYSPFDKSQQVNVVGIAPGKKVRCPYTGKIFLVP
jgi:hypothetical protein